VFRPGDANEVVEAWRTIMELKHEPAVLVLSRQAMPTVDRTKYAAASGLRKGAYILADTKDPQVILIGTGTEVGLCLAAHEQLVASGVRSRVVSMPCWELFEHQDEAYRAAVLPPHVTARIAVEQAAAFGWERYVGYTGAIIAMKTFGASAPLKELQTKFGFAPDKIVAAARAQLSKEK
jgi:transketolase